MRWLILLAILTAAPRARADTPVMAPPKPSEEPARGAMKTYFKGEMRGGYTLIAMGTVEMLAGAAMLVGARASDDSGGNPTVRGAAIPILTIGFLHAAAGIFVNVASAKRVRVFGDEINRDSDGWIRREEKRMKGVSRQFLTLEIVETVLAAGGIATAIIVRDDHPVLAGAGLGLATMMAATFVFDVVAARRAHRYRRTLAGIAF